MEQNILDCVIIGSGPSGFTAAIYAARADLKPELYTGLEPGGQLTTTTEVENFPGYPAGITGPEMMMDLQKQAERFDTKIHYEMITRAEFSKEVGGIHKVYAGNKEILARTVIISTGATAKYLGLDDEKKYAGGGVSACATCDGFFYRGKDVVVVGAGDTAAEEATYLSKLCNKVTMLVRKDVFRASKTMVHRVENTPNIEVKFNHELIGIEGENNLVERAIVIDNQTQQVSTISVDGIFIAIGHKPNTDVFAGQIDLDENGYIVTEKGTAKTNLPGVFAAGDVQDHIYRQAITAAGSGCMAAMDAEKYLGELE
ncbi:MULTISPECIES: thioredoxin-disulfide reductase [Chryseobacterium]|uniref:Thioredoxin reductase n=1 Tax=Chryseobacterium camelliae TaxID=1265445 RepID=A0ABU0TFF4_9FLAO|nr:MULTISPECIES: thioredoxin-disulfide reductase [Chryseobacterium]MDT3406412.1 thioredoxin reductase (NADPH) [Pseudacidovorax intermedius]MDQ1095788.1 thioredoxin reductase (NADPH) [Chryseobacterium camelliae]MDQ1099725.1 thioredoxin reductase (NADPH) [Chryseobacterium sp. SORGH_AS_1048]MDR6087073.1 thioredoxin reductase (NADPH) [Chryseobacterium sp. SORGH_AS_0909]MDR6131446.1 thioredoxin reductase (NADPH) [Chryseobacterium sp. SORGH_AS_1175]